MRYSSLAIGAALLMPVHAPGQAQAQSLDSGSSMLPHCVNASKDDLPTLSKGDTAMAGVCMGMSTAILKAGHQLAPPVKSCAPSDVTATQALLVLVKYMQATPKALNDDLTSIAMVAFAQAWPCK